MIRHVSLKKTSFKKIWDDRGTNARPNDGAVFHPDPPAGCHAVGSVFCRGNDRLPPETMRVLVVSETDATAFEPLVAPVTFAKLWEDRGTELGRARGARIRDASSPPSSSSSFRRQHRNRRSDWILLLWRYEPVAARGTRWLRFARRCGCEGVGTACCLGCCLLPAACC